MATTLFDMRLDEEIKAKAEKAAVLLGMKSLTEYVSKLMDEDTNRVNAGQATGRGKKGPNQKAFLPIKDIGLYPLRENFRTVLGA